MNLLTCQHNKPVIISAFTDEEVELRLHEYGVCKGSSVKRLSKAPFSGPILLETEVSKVAIRRKHAKHILVT